MPPPLLVLHAPRRDPAPFKAPWVGQYTDFAAERICDEVAAGRTLARICIEEAWAPSLRTVYNWIERKPDFKAAYEFAKILRAEKMADDILEVAYDVTLDPDDKRIIIAAHQWLAGKMNAGMWGDRKIIDVNANASVRTVREVDVSHLSLDEIHAAESALVKIIEGEVNREAIEDRRGLGGAAQED